MKHDLSGRHQAVPAASLDPAGNWGAEMVLQSCPALDLFAVALVSHWIQAASRRTWMWTSRLLAAETKPGGTDGIADSWSN